MGFMKQAPFLKPWSPLLDNYFRYEIEEVEGGVLSPAALVLPEEAVSRMLREIPQARRVDIPGTNHYSILLQSNEIRDRAVLDFLAE